MDSFQEAAPVLWAFVFSVTTERSPIGVFTDLIIAEEWIAANWRSEWDEGAQLARYIINAPMQEGQTPPYFRYKSGSRQQVSSDGVRT